MIYHPRFSRPLEKNQFGKVNTFSFDSFSNLDTHICSKGRVNLGNVSFAIFLFFFGQFVSSNFVF